jgi:hypothetical protein
MLALSELIRELRTELQTAIADGTGQDLRFALGPVELEVTVTAEREGGPSGKVRIWVLEAGAERKKTQGSTQHLKLTLTPRLYGHAQPMISDEALPGEN